MIDSLIQFVLDEIAMDGDAGTTVEALTGFVESFFNPPDSLDTAAPACRPAAQNSDADFLAFVWDTLLAQPDIHVASLEPLDQDAAPEPAPPVTTTGRQKKVKAAPPPPTHFLRYLDEPERSSGRDALVATYSDNLRIVAGPNACWLAMTRSHERPTSVTEAVYAVLQRISRARGEGMTNIEISTSAGVDPKSTYHYVKTILALGIVKKFPAIYNGSKTNRILHVRYLSVSPYWKLYIASDDAVPSDVEAASSDDDVQALYPAGQQKLNRIGRAYISGNQPLIRDRIIRVLKQREGHQIPHGEIVKAIGVHDHQKRDLRLLNGIIDRMMEEGLVSKIAVVHPSRAKGANHDVSTPYVQLLEKQEDQLDEDSETDEAEIPQEYTGAYTTALATVPIDRQILDLLAEADTRGMRNKELSAALGGYTSRTIDQVLNKLVTQGPPPPHLGDMHVVSVGGNQGREKFLTWFLYPAWERRCAADGADPPPALDDIDKIGGWADLEPVGFYEDAADLDKSVRRDPEASKSTTGKKQIGRSTLAQAKAKAVRAAKKVVKVVPPPREPSAPVSEASAPTSRKAKAKPVAKTGKLTYYEKSKLAKAERERLGLPPKEKRPPSGGGRKKKEVVVIVDPDEEEDAATPIQDQTPAADSPPRANATASSSKSTALAKTPAPVASSSKSKAAPPKSATAKSTPAASTPAPADAPTAQKSAKGKGKATAREEAQDEVTKKRGRTLSSAAADTPATKKRASKDTPAAAAPPPALKAVPLKVTALGDIDRQKQIVNYVEYHGGIVEKTSFITQKLCEFAQQQNPTVQAYMMDRNVFLRALDVLVERGILSQTTCIWGENIKIRRDLILRLPLTIDSPEYKAFATKLQTEEPVAKPRKPRINYKTEETEEKEEKRTWKVELSDIPSSKADRATVRAFFSRQSMVLASQYGVHYGRFPRARDLHLSLLQTITTDNPAVNVGGEEFIVNKSVIFRHLPLGVFLKIVPLNLDSPTLLEFTSDPANSATPLSQLPQNILAQINQQDTAKQITIVLRCLMNLEIIEPLRVVVTGAGPENPKEEAAYMVSKKDAKATHWRLQQLAPMYSYQDVIPQLVSVHDISTIIRAKKYWSSLETVALSRNHEPKSKFSHPDFSKVFGGTVEHRSVITSKSKWKDEPFLIENQRRYLNYLVQDEDNPLDPALVTPAELKAIAYDILAPYDLVTAYMEKAKIKAIKDKRKRARRAEIENDDESMEDEDDSEGEAAVRGVEDDKIISAAKRNQVDAQRQKDFESIKSRFLANRVPPTDAANPKPLNPELLDYLKTKFCVANAAIGSKELENEFLILWNYAHNINAATTPSIIPSKTVANALTRKAGDPYQIPPAKSKQKSKKIAVAKVNNTAAKAGPSAAISLGDQNEFLSVPAKEYPDLKDKQRLPRNHYTPEQIELSVDVAAILLVRAKTNDLRIAWGAMEEFFGGPKPKKDDKKAPKINLLHKRTLKGDGLVYFERLQKEWTRVYKEKHAAGELPDPNPTSMTRFDLSGLIRCLRANIDKDALRLAGPDAPEEEPDLDELPATLAAFEQQFDLDIPASLATLENRWDAFWKSGNGGKVREDSLSKPFSVPYKKHALPTHSHEMVITMQAIKMLHADPDKDYSPEQAKAFLDQFAKDVEPAVAMLFEHQLITNKEAGKEGRQIPNRGYRLSDKFTEGFDETLKESRVKSANAMTTRLADGEEREWSLTADDGDMLALLDLFSRGMLKFEINTGPSAELRKANGYQTRQTSDLDLELEIRVARDSQDFPTEFHPSTHPTEIERTDDTKLLDTALEALMEEEKSLSTELETVAFALSEAGEDGMTLDALVIECKLGRSIILACVDQLVSTSPPCAFWSGHNDFVIVSSIFLAHWAVDVCDVPLNPPPTLVKSKKLKAIKPDSSTKNLVLPVIWTGLKGQFNEVYWNKATRWVHGALLTHPGLTCRGYFKKADRLLLLSLEEVRAVLEMFVQEEFVTVKYSQEAVEGMDWETARFYKAS